MTQLIGVLCEKRAQVILLSDRMVTTADGSLAFEHEAKCECVPPNALILRAGTIHEPELITDAIKEIKGSSSVREIAESLAKSYRQIRKKRIEHEVLEEVGIPSLDAFYRMQGYLHENTILELSAKIERYNLGVVLLLGGVDEKAHLYTIEEPGTYKSYDDLGFCCVGSGDRHAEPVFAFYRFSPSLPAAQALQIAFVAKKRAEMAGGVGARTDAWVIEKGGIYGIAPETLEELEDGYAGEASLSQFFKPIELKKTKFEYPASQA